MKNKTKFQTLKDMVLAGNCKIDGDILFKNGKYINVFTEEVKDSDVLIKDGYIVAIGDLKNAKSKVIIDLKGKIIVPSFIDSHIHLESSMVTPDNFEKAVLPHGTQAVIVDPHEIANVSGILGIEYILEATENLAIDVYVNIPSCVPSTSIDESGYTLPHNAIEKYFTDNDKKYDRVLGLAEVMDTYHTCLADDDIINKELNAINNGKLIDGHAPGLTGDELNAYIASGVENDHECTNEKEAIEKIEKGMWVFVREGTASKDLNALIKMFTYPYYNRCALASDDKHPGDLINLGHIDYMVRKAISLGADPIKAIKMGTLNPSIFFGLKRIGAIAPSYKANFFITDDIKKLNILDVYKDGMVVASNGKCLVNNKLEVNTTILDKVHDSFNLSEITLEKVNYGNNEKKIRAIKIIPGNLLSDIYETDCHGKQGNNAYGVDIDRDIVKVINIERHHNTGHIGFAFLNNYGLKKGAIASTIAHDSHNLIIAGTNDEDIVLAANTIRNNKGGLCITCDGKVLDFLPLEVAGLMSEDSIENVDRKLEGLKEIAYSLGVNKDIDPFMTLSFMALPVIPKLKITTKGLVDVNTQKIVPALY